MMSKRDTKSNDLQARWSFRWVIGLFVLVFLSVVSVSAWLGLRYLEQRIRESTGDSLGIVVKTTHESLRAWVRAEKEYAEQFGRDSQLVELTAKLLTTARSRDDLSLLVLELPDAQSEV